MLWYDKHMDNANTPSHTTEAPQPTPPVTPLPKTKLGRSWQLVKHSWAVTTRNSSFVRVQLLGMLLGIAVFAALLLLSFIALVGFVSISGQTLATESGETSLATQIFFMAGAAIFLFTSVTMTTYVSVAMSYGALRVFGGNQITAKECFRAANARLKSIVSFSLVTATVGFVLDQIGRRVPFVASIAVRLVGAAWNIATMFAVPLIASRTEPIDGISVVRESARTLKQIWGESLVTQLGVGLVAGIVIITTVLGGMVLSFVMTATLSINPVWMIVATIILLVALSIIFSILGVIVQTALFYYAKTGQAPAHFSPQLLNSVVVAKHKPQTPANPSTLS